jgi:hypothetical protein
MSALLSMTAAPVSAEWFIDLYGGGTFIASSDVTFKRHRGIFEGEPLSAPSHVLESAEETVSATPWRPG